jgi:hypothetical protein
MNERSFLFYVFVTFLSIRLAVFIHCIVESKKAKKRMGSRPPALTRLNLYRIFLALAILEGLLALGFLFRIPSESGHSFLLAFSLARLGMGLAVLFIVGIFIAFLVDSLGSQKLLKLLAAGAERVLAVDISHVIIKTVLAMFLAASLASLLFYAFPPLQKLIFFLPDNYIFTVLGERAGGLVGWFFLISLKILLLYFTSGRKAGSQPAIPVKLMTVSWILEGFLLALFLGWSLIARKFDPGPFTGPGIKILVLSIWFTSWTLLNRNEIWAGRLFRPFLLISIFLCVFTVSLQFDQWFNIWGPRPDDQYILLADSFLHGKLYYVNVPYYRHDMNYFNGVWYQSKPPFPILLITPFVAIWGVNGFNINTFSLVLSALSAVMVYLILERLKQLGWIKLSQAGAIWLTVLFEFGTVFWWLSILGTAGPFSQVVTVFFCALAFLITLKKGSPWLAGLCLAAAVMSRPNVFVLWPAVVFIAIQFSSEGGKVDWKGVVKPGTFSAIPIVLGAGLLLYYNFLRYGTFTDFGYGTLNGSQGIVQNVQDYGLFSPHFIPVNLRVMFLALPELTRQCAYLLPYGDGISIFMSTPAIVYLFRRFEFSWWLVGCWISILCSLILLSMYSNTGANQYGYRYVMDFFIPVIMVIGYNVGERVSGVLKSLIIASLLINYYGTISTLNVSC